ncbi:hypothetical protein [Catenuloplanes atrovinosus]|uniref:Uncharacterized protein n=1 Tax=Catenuloplanes atrovinosus TaxID=137266 RepID=A0AAE4C8K6_9ACTN|nr:hypothetical protein [Catenuloplanes atrovinosus]MDR7274722.1 hypothetical protein [Catenuloplanes atrovinosus]
MSAVPSTPPAPETPADALEAAQFVITADIGRKVGTADFHGVAGNVYSVSNVGLRGWKGDDEGFADLRVLSTPAINPSEPYPTGDPLTRADRLILFLTRDKADEMWRTLSVEHGTLPAIDGEVLPSNWPAP